MTFFPLNAIIQMYIGLLIIQFIVIQSYSRESGIEYYITQTSTAQTTHKLIQTLENT